MLKYLKGTKNLGIMFKQNRFPEPLAYTDVNWAEKNPEMRSTSDQIIIMAGPPVSWWSTRQTSVAKSTTEVKYISISEATCELIWLNNLLADTGLLAERATELCAPPDVKVDNKNVIDLANSKSIKQQSKHIEVCYHLLRDLIKKNEIKLTHVESAYNATDGLTKPLAKGKFGEFHEMIDIVKI